MATKIFPALPIPFFTFLLLSSLFITPEPQLYSSMTLHTSSSNILGVYGNVVYLRGIGRSGDLQSASGMWSSPYEAVFDWQQKWCSIESNVPKMKTTFQCYRDIWHVNMIRLLIPVDWWWIDTVHPLDYQPDALYSASISYRDYIETVVKEAAKYGIYVDFCPYSAVNSYLYSGQSEGEPGTWIPQTASHDFIQNVTAAVSRTESQFWREWWTSVVDRIGKYANVFFEMWNEPQLGKNQFFSYMVESYQTIRGLGNQNLIFMQWQLGIVPGEKTLTWAPELYVKLKQTIGAAPTNLVFTTHPYRHAPYPNLQWATQYRDVKNQLLDPTMVPQTRSPQCNVPLVFNEMGVLDADHVYGDWPGVYKQFGLQHQTIAERREEEYSFWDAVLHSAKDLGIGVCAYYWMQDSAATGYGYGGESLVTSGLWRSTSPPPNIVGQIFINYSLSAWNSWSWRIR